MIKYFCCVCLIVSFCFATIPAFAAKQKYTRHYQKKTTYKQKKDHYSQKKDLPVSNAYLQVNRKKPTVKVTYSSTPTAFQTDSENVLCNGKTTLSCTYFSVSFSSSADCDTSKIDVNVTETQPMLISVSSLYEKGTCQFDQILKHELTHEIVYRKVLQSFLEKTAQDLIREYESGQINSKGCEEIQQKIDKIGNDANKDFVTLVQSEQAKLDSDQGDHFYDMDICQREISE